MAKRQSKRIKIGDIGIGGDAPVSVQSMLSKPSGDIAANLAQARELAQNGCEIIRVAVPDLQAVRLIEALKKSISCPIVADIHFDYRIAVACASAGADKIRINPGNIGGLTEIRTVANACNAANIPIRIGVNSGSVERQLLAKHGGPTPQAMVESALEHIRLLNVCDFDNIVISLKSSDVPTTYEAYRLMAAQCEYPLHLGVTEAGSYSLGIVKSAVGIGSLLMAGIGDTIRVSLTANPIEEVRAAVDILKVCGLRSGGVQIISCPTCGRTKIDLISLVNQLEERLSGCEKTIKIAVMGCVVNGPGEAREADLGIAGGDGCGVLFRKGQILRKVEENHLIDELIEEIERYDNE